MAADLLTTIRSELDARLGELRPRLAEYERLVAAVEALALAPADGPTPVTEERSTPLPTTTLLPVATPTLVSEAPALAGSPAPAVELSASVVPAPRRRGRPSSVAKRERAPKGAAKQAILAALEHGSHSVGELAVVTAMSGPNINGNIRRLLQEGAITKTSREGKTAYALIPTV